MAQSYKDQQEYAYFISSKRDQYPDLLDQVDLKTPWHIIEEVLNGNYSNLTSSVEQSLALDTLRIAAANF